MKTKALLCFIQYGPYHFARLSAAQTFLSEECELRGWEISPHDSTYGWERESVQDNLIISAGDFPVDSVSFVTLFSSVWKSLNQENPDVLYLAGYAHRGMLVAVLWAKAHGRKIVLMSDTKENDAPRKAFTEKIKSLIVRCFDAAIVAGKASEEYLAHLGMPKTRIFSPYDVVDNASFARKSPLPERTLKEDYFLCVSRFIPRKNIARLIDAYKIYKDQCLQKEIIPYSLALCGDGPELVEIQNTIQRLELTKDIHLLGFVQAKHLRTLLWHAQAIVQPSTIDMWLLAVNEAMAAEVSVLVSETCGCVPELAENGATAWTFNPFSIQQIAETLLAFHQASPTERRDRVDRAKKRVESKFSLECFAQAMKSALKCII